MRKKSRTLTENELEIMQVVWELETATVRQVYEKLRQDRQVAYTTVMTMMKILEEKGYLTRTLDGRAHVYQPIRPRGEVISGMVQEFVDRVFDGSARPLVLSLVKDRRLSEQDLAEISKLIEESE